MAGRHRQRSQFWPKFWVIVGCIVVTGSAVGIVNLASTAPRYVSDDPLPPIPPSVVPDLPMTFTNPPVPTTTPPAPPTTTPSPPTTTVRTTRPKPTEPPIPRGAIRTSTLATGSTFGGVHPFVAVIGRFLAKVYGYQILGVGERETAGSDHPVGYALDVMVGVGNPEGDDVAACVLKNQKVWGVSYVIWKQRINDGTGWVLMEDRGGVTANHYDHVHISFEHSSIVLPLYLSC